MLILYSKGCCNVLFQLSPTFAFYNLNRHGYLCHISTTKIEKRGGSTLTEKCDREHEKTKIKSRLRSCQESNTRSISMSNKKFIRP